jgi:dTDP-glucose 4,6-dehydratase
MEWSALRSARIWLTGGTGFWGRGLLTSALDAERQHGLGLQLVVHARHPERLYANLPTVADHLAVTLWAGDIANGPLPPGPFTHVIHAATDAGRGSTGLATLDTIVTGTRRVLDHAIATGAQRFLLASSGAVYGRQPPELFALPEDFPGAPLSTDPRSAYGLGKHLAEQLVVLYTHERGLPGTIARGFAFVGPGLPLDGPFAAGNFVRDALAGGPIRVRGDGTAVRSYLAAHDLADWLWTILLRGQPGRAYNVGSAHPVTIAELAFTVARLTNTQVEIAQTPTPGQMPERYVPDVARATTELGVRERTDWTVALAQLLNSHKIH